VKFRVGLTVLAAVVASATAGTAAAPAGAALTCGGESKRPFLPWLDPLEYGLANGGSAESTAGWALSGGARLVSGNEPFFVNSKSDEFSLALPAGGTATSPWTCVGLDGLVARLFAVSSGSPLATLNVELLYKTSKGKIKTIGGISVIPGLLHGSWAPTLPIVLALDTLLRDVLVLDLNKTEIAFRFRASSGWLTSATWRIDDLYVDPWVDKLGW